MIREFLSGATFPRWHGTTHELFHLLHVLALVDHLVAVVVPLVVEIIQQVVDL